VFVWAKVSKKLLKGKKKVKKFEEKVKKN